MPYSLNLRHLQAAFDIGKAGSFSRAAAGVYLSQSALTQAISRLEHKLESALFSRTSTGVLTTDAGTVFLKRIARAQRWLKAIEQTVHGPDSTAPKKLVRLLTSTQLRALSTVVESGSYTRAARMLGVSQPTVYRAVKELENLCQQRFFSRAPQGVEPSWQARQIARYANLYFSEINQGITEIRELNGMTTGSIIIGALPLSRTRLVPNAVNRLLAKYPGAKVRIVDGSYEEQLHGLLHGQIDVIVGALRSPAPSPDITQEWLFADPLNIVVRNGHWLASTTRTTPVTLRQLEWIAPRKHTPAREIFSDFFRRDGLEPPEHVIECSSLTAIRSLLLNSDRAALLPANQVAVDVDAGLLAVSPYPLADTRRDIGITLRRGWEPTNVQKFLLSMLREQRK